MPNFYLPYNFLFHKEVWISTPNAKSQKQISWDEDCLKMYWTRYRLMEFLILDFESHSKNMITRLNTIRLPKRKIMQYCFKINLIKMNEELNYSKFMTWLVDPLHTIHSFPRRGDTCLWALKNSENKCKVGGSYLGWSIKTLPRLVLRQKN